MTFPRCFVQAHDLRQEKDGKQLELTARAIMGRERECDSFTPWIQGFSPKEHKEMLDQRQLLEWQRKAQQDDREWRERQRRDDLEWKERQEKAAGRQFRWQLIVVGVIATVVLAVAQIVGSLIQAGHLFPRQGPSWQAPQQPTPPTTP